MSIKTGDRLPQAEFNTMTADAATRLKSVETKLASLREQQKTARDGAAVDLQYESERQERLAKFFGTPPETSDMLPDLATIKTSVSRARRF